MPWKTILACATGQVESTLLRKLEYVLEENRVYRAVLQRHAPHWRLNNQERIALAEKGKALGKLLGEVMTIVQPETLLKWHRQLVAKKWDFSRRHKTRPGRPTVTIEVEKLVVQFARENPLWGYDRITGALANLGHAVSAQTVGNILRKHGLTPTFARRRCLSWAEFIRRHKDVLWATDFFTTEIWTQAGLTTYYILFFIQVSTRKIVLGGATCAPNETWMKQVTRNVTGEEDAFPRARYLLHDRDSKFTDSFDQLFRSIGTEPLKLPPRSPNLNAFAERWVRSVKEECLDQLILFGERSLLHALREYIAHYHHERNHQGLGNVIPFPDARAGPKAGRIIKADLSRRNDVVKAERLGGLLNFYYRQPA